MSLAVEIVTFPPSEAYRKDAALITPVAQYLKENSEALGYVLPQSSKAQLC